MSAKAAVISTEEKEEKMAPALLLLRGRGSSTAVSPHLLTRLAQTLHFRF